MIRFAQFLSTLFNPVVIAVFVPFLVVYKVSESASYALQWEIFSLFYLIVVILFVVFGVKKGFFSDFDVSKRRERPVLYLYAGILSVLYLVSLLYFQAPLALILVAVALILGIVIMDLINILIKASDHVAIITSFIISLGIWYNHWFFFGIVLIPIVAWSRIITKRHTFVEAVVGGTVGTLLTLFLSFMIQYIF